MRSTMGTVEYVPNGKQYWDNRREECMTFVLALQNIHFRIKIDPTFQNTILAEVFISI
jgi:hypothetical protein